MAFCYHLEISGTDILSGSSRRACINASTISIHHKSRPELSLHCGCRSAYSLFSTCTSFTSPHQDPCFALHMCTRSWRTSLGCHRSDTILDKAPSISATIITCRRSLSLSVHKRASVSFVDGSSTSTLPVSTVPPPIRFTASQPPVNVSSSNEHLSSAASYKPFIKYRSGELPADVSPSPLNLWAWPILHSEMVSPYPTSQSCKFSEKAWSINCFGGLVLTSISSSKILDGFTEALIRTILHAMLYFSFLKSFSSFSIEEKTLPPCLLSLKEEDFSALPSKSSRFCTILSSCVAVSTGPEDASETTSAYLVGENWVSTSLVTKFQPSDFVVKVPLTHSSFLLSSLSSSHEDLSRLSPFVYVFYVYYQRGWIIPSYCIQTS